MLGIIIHILVLLIAFLWLVSSPGYESILAFLGALGLYFKNEVFAFFGTSIMSLTPKKSIIKDLSKYGYSFTSEKLINPKIIEDLDGWISDSGDEVTSINVTSSNNSNRYFNNKIVTEEAETNPIIKSINNNEYYAYQLIGKSINGVYILRTWSCGGGSGVFNGLIFVIISEDSCVDLNFSKNQKIDRLVIKKIGRISLGDRYNGKIRYKCGLLSVGRDNNPNGTIKKNKHIFIL